MSAMTLLLVIVLTLISIILCVRQITKHKARSTAANVAYYGPRNERLCEVDNLPLPLPPRNKTTCPEYATIADPDGAMSSSKNEPFVVNTKENVAYDVVQNTDTSSYSGYSSIDEATSSQGDPATEVNDAYDVLENEVDFEKRSDEVAVKDNIAYSIESKEENCDYAIVSDGISITKVLL